jgi:enterochelin esterase-like enzyme
MMTGQAAAFGVPVPALGAAIEVRTWAPAGAADDEPLPLLLAHDGPEYDTAGLTAYLAAGAAGGCLPRLRAALLAPGQRDRWYSASARYSRALAHAVLPAVTARLATTARIGMGASLGALAMLHAQCRYPGTFGALFLQSGSFFSPGTDGHQGLRHYQRIVAFVAGVHAGALPGPPIPVVLTCGAGEENIGNNRLMAAALRRGGHQADLHEVPGGHDFAAWHDALDPYLTGLLRQAGRPPRDDGAADD